MTELKFEWDEAKNIANQKKHGVGFDEAATVFSDELARLIPDPEHSTDEDRFILLGMSDRHRLVLVSHCERDTDLIRIISARKADKRERKAYESFHHA